MSRDARPDSSGDAERDAWLREALRHAPDANAGAPPDVRDAILRQAREAAAATPAHRANGSRRSSPWSAWWSWLMQPPVAAGFASVMVATLVGVMWWGQPIDETLREANQPDVAAPVASPAPAVTSPSPAVLPEAPPAEAAPPPPAREAEAARRVPAQPPRATQALPPARSDPAARRESAQPDGATAPAESSAQRKERTSPPPEAAAKQAADRNAASPPPAGAVAAPAPPAVAPPATPAPAVAAAIPPPERKREADALADNDRPAADAATESAEAKAIARAGAPTPAAADARSQAATRSAALGAAERDPSVFAAPSLAVAPALADPLARLRSAVAAQPDAWTWQRGSGPEQPMNDAVQVWLAQLDRTTRTRWQALPGALESGSTQTLRLLRDGRLHSTVRIDATGVQVDPVAEAAAPVARRAPLPAADAAALATALERAAP